MHSTASCPILFTVQDNVCVCVFANVPFSLNSHAMKGCIIEHESMAQGQLGGKEVYVQCLHAYMILSLSLFLS